jgi:very-short-patch-repair endonuclease
LTRDADPLPLAPAVRARGGKRYIAVIGIDQYEHWRPLRNAVADARGVQAVFAELGFVPFGQPLFDEAATAAAIESLVVDQLRELQPQDSVVLFFAGHGHSESTLFDDSTSVTTGYILPVDADRLGGSLRRWLNLKSLLSQIDRLPALHILVILDSCHAGIAIDPQDQWRGQDLRPHDPMERLRARRSRHILTSALDNERACDSGPVPGHSLFTGCLIDALRGGISQGRATSITGSELAVYVRNRVLGFPGAHQTPGFGALPLHHHGDLIIDLASRPQPAKPAPTARPAPARPAPSPPPPKLNPKPTPSAKPFVAAPPSPLFAALDRHHQERLAGGQVLTLLAGTAPSAALGWARWAAQHGWLTLLSRGDGVDAAIAELLAQVPWLRCVAAARQTLAAAAGIEVSSVDASLDARSISERVRWIANLTGGDPRAQVAGWLLSLAHEPLSGPPDPATAPIRGGALLAILCDLAPPVALLVHASGPTAERLVRAITTAAALTELLPRLPVAVSAPASVADEVLSARRASRAFTMARQGLVKVARLPPAAATADQAGEQALYAALSRDPRTSGRFERQLEVPVHERARTTTVALIARAECLVIELDRWHHERDDQRYQRDHIKDVWLQRAGFFVLRFLAEDVEQRLLDTVEEIAVVLAARRPVVPSLETSYDELDL